MRLFSKAAYLIKTMITHNFFQIPDPSLNDYPQEFISGRETYPGKVSGEPMGETDEILRFEDRC
jgi:hypothetical protein